MADELVMIGGEQMVKRPLGMQYDHMKVLELKAAFCINMLEMARLKARNLEIKAILEGVALQVEEQITPN